MINDYDQMAFDVMIRNIDPKTIDRDTARHVLLLLQPGRCKGNPNRLILRRLSKPRGVTAKMQQLRDRVQRVVEWRKP